MLPNLRGANHPQLPPRLPDRLVLNRLALSKNPSAHIFPPLMPVGRPMTSRRAPSSRMTSPTPQRKPSDVLAADLEDVSKATNIGGVQRTPVSGSPRR